MPDLLPTEEATDEPSDFGSLKPGTHLGRYELLVPIARGGMARVWAARQHGQRGFQKLVAIKTILPNLAQEPEFERMFLDEARIASGVHHPNVCEIYELGEERRTLYLAMEWVSGDSLSRVLRASGKTEALDVRVVARIVADACAGAHAAHELADEDGRQLGVVHRDLSPHNILLSADGVAKVCDFGVAKALDQLHEQTTAGQLKGKLSYMSPEQIGGGPLDRRSDVFSLGCVLYEATTGVRPFRGDRDHLIMQAILSGEVEPPTKIIRSYPPELERIVLRALAQQPIIRYPSAERMRFALEEFLTKGQLVTQSNVAHALRTRIGEMLERRKERIRQASSAAEQGAWDPANAPPTRDAVEHRSGVKPAGEAPRTATPSYSLETDDTVHGFGLPGSSTLPQVSPSTGHGTLRPPSHTTQTLPMPAPAPNDFSVPAADSSPGRGPMLSAHTIPPSSGMRSHEARAAEPLGQGREPAAAQYALAAAIGLLIAVMIGGGGFYLWNNRATQSSAMASTTSPAANAPMLQSASAEIAFRTTPPDAVLVVDGTELPRDTRSIRRPAAGRTVTVVMRAKGHEDSSVQVDYFTTTPIVFVLKPIIELDAPPAGSTVTPPVTTAPPGKPHSAPKPRVTAPAVLPDNPY